MVVTAMANSTVWGADRKLSAIKLSTRPVTILGCFVHDLTIYSSGARDHRTNKISIV